MPRSRTVWKDGQLFAEYENGVLTYLNPDYRPPARSDLPAPRIMRDIGEYVSPLDGQMITSRSQHRDHMRAHDVIEVGNERMPSAPETAPRVNQDLGQAIKRRIEEVQTLPQRDYDSHVQVQQAEHAEVAALVTAA